MKAIILFIDTHQRTIQRILFTVLLLALGGYFAGMAFVSEGVLEPGDGIVHYTIAKYAPQKPELFLDHWGKPLFTLLSSPFAQMGFPGMIVFNVMLYLITSTLLFLWAEKRKNPFAWLVPILLVSSLIYFDMVNAGMTEVLFATILTATIYLFFDKKYLLGSIIFSFSLFSRPEGMLVMPVIILFLLWKRQWKAIPFLGLGFVIYSIVGYFYYKDFLWYIHENPYPAKVPFYGNGGLFDFFKANQSVWGPFMTVFCALGVACIILSLFTRKKKLAFDYLLLIITPGILILCVHSYIWWKGIHGSLGLVRVITTAVPIFVFLSLVFLNSIQKQVFSRIIPSRYFSTLMLFTSIGLGGLLFMKNIRFTILPVKQTPHQQLLSEAASWYTDQNNQKKIYYMDPYFAFKANLNPYDQSKVGTLYSVDKTNPAMNLQSGDYIVWDAHFSPNDGGVSKEKITQNPSIEILKIFSPQEAITGLGNQPYEIIMARVK